VLCLNIGLSMERESSACSACNHTAIHCMQRTIKTQKIQKISIVVVSGSLMERLLSTSMKYTQKPKSPLQITLVSNRGFSLL